MLLFPKIAVTILFAGLPIIIVEMWFVVTRKKAFESDPEMLLPGPQPIS
jgi:hypothetical protein